MLAYAWNYPDGLCGGALASTMDAPLILTMTGYESQAGEYVQSHGISKGTILGGVGLISDDSVCAIYAIHTLRDMAMVYHNATNFGYQKVEYTQEDLEDWYEVIWAG